MKIWFCLTGFLLILSCGSKPKEAAGDEAATPVEVTAATSGSMHHVVSAEAVLYPVNQATIVPKISAPVQKFLVQRGDHVKQGQLLAMLEDQDLRATTQESRELYQQAQATLENTRAVTLPDDLTKSKSDLAAAQEGVAAAQKLYDNRVALFKDGALAQKLVDDAKVALVQAQSQLDTARQHLTSLQAAGQSAQLKSSEAQANAAKAHYESSAAQSSYGEVRSPISGVVADRGVNVGDVASSGSALFSIVDISRIVARANVPVNEATALRPGQAATIEGPEHHEAQGKVIVVSPTVDANTTTVQVWVEASNPGEALKLGSTVTIIIEAGRVADAVIVPVSALLASDDGGEKVMVAMPDGTAQERKVEVGVRNGDNVQILSGVKPGENIITSGGLGLDDKARIEISKPQAGKSEDEK
jgi:multidrug efflux pump subunit AcrA (membrane-fusion protein)